jgi:hypothetical protein
MAISSQNFKKILEAFKSQLYDTLCDTLHDKFHDLADGLNNSFHSSWDSMHERFLMADIRDEYNQDIYVRYDFEDDCDDWYMDSCHLWDDNHFHILFDDSTPSYVEDINVSHLRGIRYKFLSFCRPSKPSTDVNIHFKKHIFQQRDLKKYIQQRDLKKCIQQGT